MGFGPKVIGEAAFLAEKAAKTEKAAVGTFGRRVIDPTPPVVVVAPVPAPVVPEPAVIPAPPPAPTEAYNSERAVEVAKKNVHDLPRLLDLELARPSGPRKTVLRAYSELALDGRLADEVGLALDERITAALDAKE